MEGLYSYYHKAKAEIDCASMSIFVFFNDTIRGLCTNTSFLIHLFNDWRRRQRLKLYHRYFPFILHTIENRYKHY